MDDMDLLRRLSKFVRIIRTGSLLLTMVGRLGFNPTCWTKVQPTNCEILGALRL